MLSILVVDDDAEIAGFVAEGLTAAGYAVESVGVGRKAVERAASRRFDAIVLDRMLPDIDGVSVLRALRSASILSPVIFLSALGSTDDRIAGLKAGADDYLTKPFSIEELQARIEALLRRSALQPEPVERGGEAPVLACGDLALDLKARSAWRGSREIVLRTREFEMLRFFLERQGEVVTRAMLLEEIWNYSSQHVTNIIEVHVSRLRQKVDAPGEPSLIRTIRGVGYVLSAAPR